jgi:hypothetical protein
MWKNLWKSDVFALVGVLLSEAAETGLFLMNWCGHEGESLVR